MKILIVTLIQADNSLWKLEGIAESLYPDFKMDEEIVEFDPNISLNDDMAYCISNFSGKEFCLDVLKNTVSTVEFDDYNYKECNKKEFLLNTNNNEYFFQRITPSMLRPTRRIKFANLNRSNNTFEKTNKDESIQLNNKPDAIYIKQDDKLYFWKFSKIKKIFPGIEILYRKATSFEVKSFLNMGFITLANGFTEEKISDFNLKQIALIQDNNDLKIDWKKEELKKYISEYIKNLEYDGENFLIKNNTDLKKLLYGLEERFYTTPIGNEKYVANSAIKI